MRGLLARLRRISRRDPVPASADAARGVPVAADRDDYELGVEALRRGEIDAALAALERALDAGHDAAEVCLQLGMAELARDGLPAALDHLELALHHRPGWPGALRALGAARLHAAQYGPAAAALEQALAHGGAHAQTLSDLALAHRELGHFAEAEQACRGALELDPAFQAARFNLALMLKDQGRLEEASALLEAMLQVAPDDAEVRWSLAVVRLLAGDFERGWRDYAARWSCAQAVARPQRLPLWDGRSLAGKRILIWGEQGLGDEIMFASCVPEVAGAAAGSVLECSPKLQRLFARSFPRTQVIAVGPHGEGAAPGEAADVEAAIGSLPQLLGRTWGRFPQHGGYLRASPESVSRWRARLDGLGAGLKVGISWRGGDRRTRQRLRSVSLSEWAPVFSTVGCHFVSLQYGDAREDLARPGLPASAVVHEWAQAIEDYDETAALVCALDLVISVCTAIVHLSGALGRPVWVLVPSAPEWRYLQRGDAMPWYPSTRLYRQAVALDWSGVLGGVAADLARAVHEGRVGSG